LEFIAAGGGPDLLFPLTPGASSDEAGDLTVGPGRDPHIEARQRGADPGDPG
jgi:hypothetical protein